MSIKQATWAEEVNYFQTSTVSPDSWMDKAKKEITKIGGAITAEAYGTDESGRTAFMLRFKLDGDAFHIIWNVLKSRSGNVKAAKIQAATLLYHDVKHKCVMAKVKGCRTAFSEYLLLPNGETVSQHMDDPQRFLDVTPRMFLLSGGER